MGRMCVIAFCPISIQKKYVDTGKALGDVSLSHDSCSFPDFPSACGPSMNRALYSPRTASSCLLAFGRGDARRTSAAGLSIVVVAVEVVVVVVAVAVVVVVVVVVAVEVVVVVVVVVVAAVAVAVEVVVVVVVVVVVATAAVAVVAVEVAVAVVLPPSVPSATPASRIRGSEL